MMILHHPRVEIDNRVERLERARLPRLDLLQDCVGDVGDHLGGQFGAQRGSEVVLDVADRPPPAYRERIMSSSMLR
jgi:hypothetical protein